MPKVDYTRAEITDLKPRWDLVRDCLSGEKKIKDRGTVYLPQPNASDSSTANLERYAAYKIRAVYYNVTSRTLKGLAGQVFARDPVVSVPPKMDLMLNDIDGGGVSLDQQTRKALSHTLAHGRCGILTDYPKTEKPATIADQEAGFIRPTITLFDPWDIINWRTITIGGKKLLSLVVISESEVCDDDGFEQEWDNYYRVLRLYEGVYWSEVWYFDDKLNDFVLDSRVMPTDANGKPWAEIPFTFIGADNNDPTPDLPPLYDLAVLNIAHYRNSADYEESCYIVGQPTPYFAGLTDAWVNTHFKGGVVQLGSRTAIPLPENGSAGLLQAEANSMPFEAMQHKERQMVALGARLIEQKAVQRTATEAGMEEAGTTSVLATCAKNVSAAYTQALTWAGIFLGVEKPVATQPVEAEDGAEGKSKQGDEISYVLNTEFDLSRLTAQEQAQIIATWQANAISTEEMRDNLRRGGIAYQDDEEYKTAIEEQGPDLGVPVGSPASAAQAALDAKAKADADNIAAKAKTSGNPAGK